MIPPQQQDTTDLQAEVTRLRTENIALRRELDRQTQLLSMGTRGVAWLMTSWWGSDVRDAAHNLGSALHDWQTGRCAAPLRESIEFGGAIVARLTRIGIFRITVASLIVVGTLWFGIAQVILLQNQNRLIEAQKRGQAADLFFRFSAQREELLRVSGTAFDTLKRLQDISTLMKGDGPPKVWNKELEESRRGPVEIDRVVVTCAVALYPVGDPTSIHSESIWLADRGDVSAARTKLHEVVQWWEGANQSCKYRLDSLGAVLRQLSADMSTTPTPTAAK